MAHECACGCQTVRAEQMVAPEQMVADVAHARAGALEIMKQMGINHCCGAHLTLREAAAAAGVSLDSLLAALNETRKTPA